MVRMMRTDGHIGARIKHKWGKVGAPGSSKRKRWLKKIRRKHHRRRHHRRHHREGFWL